MSRNAGLSDLATTVGLNQATVALGATVNTTLVSLAQDSISFQVIITSAINAGATVRCQLQVANDAAGTSSVNVPNKVLTITPTNNPNNSNTGSVSYITIKAEQISDLPALDNTQAQKLNKFVRLAITTTGSAQTVTVVTTAMTRSMPAVIDGSTPQGQVV